MMSDVKLLKKVFLNENEEKSVINIISWSVYRLWGYNIMNNNEIDKVLLETYASVRIKRLKSMIKSQLSSSYRNQKTFVKVSKAL